MAREPEDRFAGFLEDGFGLHFTGPRAIGEWGRLDNVAELEDGRWLVLEVESGQKHPCTNVLKVWPWLDVDPDRRVLFVHAFFTDSVCLRGSRDRLGDWLGERLTQELEWRFQYIRVVAEPDGRFVEGAQELAAALAHPRPERGCLPRLFRSRPSV